MHCKWSSKEDKAQFNSSVFCSCYFYYSRVQGGETLTCSPVTWPLAGWVHVVLMEAVTASTEHLNIELLLVWSHQKQRTVCQPAEIGLVEQNWRGGAAVITEQATADDIISTSAVCYYSDNITLLEEGDRSSALHVEYLTRDYRNIPGSSVSESFDFHVQICLKCLKRET